jgi:hypothetical protein
VHPVPTSWVAPAGCLPYGYDVARASGADPARTTRDLHFAKKIIKRRFPMLKKRLWIVVALYPVIVVLILIASAGSDQVIMSKGLPILIILVSLFFFAFIWMFRKRA